MSTSVLRRNCGKKAETSSNIHAGEHVRDDLESCVMANEPKDGSEFFTDDDSVDFLHQKLQFVEAGQTSCRWC